MNYLDKLLEGVCIEWKSLEVVTQIKTGQSVSKQMISDNPGEYPVINSGREPLGYIDEWNTENDPIGITTRGAGVGSITWQEGKYFRGNLNYSVSINSSIEINTRYLYHLLLKMQSEIQSLCTFQGIPALNAGNLKKLQIPIPCTENPEKSIEIQKEIVRILDKFSELISELTSELTSEVTARKNQYTSYKDQLFSFNEMEVERLPLGVIGEFQRGKRFVKDDMIAEGKPCIHYGEMYTYYGTWANNSKSFLSEELVESKNLRIAENGDVVIVAAGETIEDIGMGMAWLGDEGIVIHDACFSFRSQLNPKYVAYFTRTKQFHDQIKKHISSGKISAINARGLEKALIPIPSPEEQDRIVSILDKFDILTTSICEGLPKEIELRKKQYEYYRDLLLTFPMKETV